MQINPLRGLQLKFIPFPVHSLAGRNFVGGCHATEFRPHLILAPGSLLGYPLQVKLGGEAGAH
jgi:hypothetical protein